jgi:DNA-binding NtrC family response regulator
MGHVKPFRPTAIVVEDDVIQRVMIALLLEGCDFEVVQCEDAETASLAIKVRHPSLLITDLNLAGSMDGIELAQLARQHDPDMRVVVISGNPPVSALPDGVKFLSKPLYPTTLLQEATH